MVMGEHAGRGFVLCVTIVAESIVESRLIEAIRAAGARGWTLTPARGEGPRDRRVSDIEGGNVRIETLVSEDVAERIWDVLASDYFPNYAIAAWTYPVQVARMDRYGAFGDDSHHQEEQDKT